MQASSDLRTQHQRVFGKSGRGSISHRLMGVFALPWSSLALLLLITLGPTMGAEQPKPKNALRGVDVAHQSAIENNLAASHELGSETGILSSDVATRGGTLKPTRKLIVIGFMGGKVHASNLVHREAQLINLLQQDYPLSMHAAIFANRDGDAALKTVLQLLDKNEDGRLSDDEKGAARIVIFGHSWGASETVTLADRLNKLRIPVLLTIQVDSVQKQSQNDAEIPPNVQEAVNFYQSEGLLRGRSVIVAADPEKTKILGNHESSYRGNSVSCAGFPWYARAFMKRHIQIENDPEVWGKIEEMILAKVL
jgi:hypothetical protein